MHRPRQLWAFLLVAGVLLGVSPVVGPGSSAGASGPGFQSLQPARLLDTRPGATTVDGQSAGGGPVGGGGTINLTVTGRGGVPASGVGAVVLNVAVTGPATPGFLTVFPAGSPQPATANVNFAAHQTTGNLVVAAVGANGQVSLFNSEGSTEIIADVEGWLPAGSSYNGLQPARLLDTRPGATTVDGQSAGGGPVGGGGTINLTVTGRGGVPASGVGAVVLNVAVTGPATPGFLTVFPAGSPQPATANVNFAAHQTTGNLVVAAVGANGQVSLFNSEGSTEIIADVEGWLPAGSSFGALQPARLLDTRPGATTVDGQSAGGGPVGGGGTINLTVTGRGGVPATGVAAVVLNVAVTGSATPGFLTVFPAGSPQPDTANVNFAAGQTTGNLVVAAVGANGQVSLFNSEGATEIIADVEGWLPGSPADDVLSSNVQQTLTANQWLMSPDNRYGAVMQGDGNFVIYHGSTALWATGTAGNPGAWIVMQADGNLVVYSATDQPLWGSGTYNHPGDYAELDDTGDLVIVGPSDSALWASVPIFVEGQWPGSSGPAAANLQYGYPYTDPPECTNGGACVIDAWRFYEGQCTSWVAYRLNQLNGVAFNDFYRGPQWGDASNWGATAETLGIPVDGTPTVGSVAWYADGHVSYVEQVVSSTQVVISEMNYDTMNGFQVRTITPARGWPTAFIHIKDR